MERIYNDILTYVRSLTNIQKFGIIGVGIVIAFILLSAIIQFHYNPKNDFKLKLPLFVCLAITVGLTIWFALVSG
ncbi:MAG: hypothetical protein WCR30_02100 [Clostridia bacterium]